MPKRFDTYFFLGVTDSAHAAEADGGETVRLAWMEPSRFLDLYMKQEISLFPPQFYILSTLSGTHKLSDLIAMQQGVQEALVHPWQPEPIKTEDGGKAMAYPGDVKYPEEREQSPFAPLPLDENSRHRLNIYPVPKIEGGKGGVGMPPKGPLAGTNRYELERTVPVVWGEESWGGGRKPRTGSTSKL